ncbi:MAG: hypothetical protein ACUVX8_15360 [Candidatus Zipacnadales bacterium]
MRRALVLAALVLLATISASQNMNPVTNGGFETVGPNGLPIDWSILGDVHISKEAHSGQNAILIQRDHSKGEAGLNRAWEPDSGKQGTMLAQLKGAIRFWYKAVSGTDDAVMHFFVIPMSDRPFEDTGEMRADFVVPKLHIGDGEWHQGLLAYNFTNNPKVKWVHLSPRILGTQAALLLDDIEWLERAGPVLTVGKLRWEEDPKRPGECATLAVRVKNIGDETSSSAIVKVSCPDYLRIVGQNQATVPVLPPEQYEEVRFVIEGRRDHADVINVMAEQRDANTPPAVAQFRIEPAAELIQLRADRFILAPAERTTLRAIIRGTGTAIAMNLHGKLEVPPSVVVIEAPTEPLEVAPGREVALSWRVQAAPTEVGFVSVMARLMFDRSPLGEKATTLVVGPKIAPAPDRPGAHVTEKTAWLQGKDIRLVLHRTQSGFGIADLQVKTEGWQSVARMPSLGRIVTPSGLSSPNIRPLYGTVREAEGALVVDCTFTDEAGRQWTATVTFSLRDEDRNIGVTSRLRCNHTAKLLAFDAPMLYVGEGTFGTAKDEALFPGLDWLDSDDMSSEYEGRLIAKGHPHQVRYVPHPNMITIPLMSVYHKGTTVGLLWDHRRKWDDSHDRPAAVFASPDRFEGRNAHTMGLFIPSVAEEGKPWVKPNERIAWTPYDLPANREVGLEAVIYARTHTSDALSALEEWFRIYGVPEPRPYPQGSVEAQVAFNMHAYLDSMWDAKEQMWWNTRGAGKLLSYKARPLSFIHELLEGALIIEDYDPLLAERCRSRAKEVLTLTGGRPHFTDSGFDYGRPAEYLIGSGTAAVGHMASQDPDGAWRFDADRKDQGVFKGLDYHELGADNSVALGTCAQHAYALLRFARLTGESQAYAAGVKALRFMQRFRVPRAAQVWEVNFHAPDILAAADAVDAYLEAYQYDGRQEWLEEAVKWGKGGLPFVYMWDDPEKPFVLGASIPVFGASWNIHSWFGRPVQWNGLRHARALLKLAKYDDRLPWKQFAALLITSAMYQQSTDPDDIALWPDSISAINGSKAGWIFAPLHISEPFYMLIGRQGEPDTVILGKLPERIHFSSGAVIESASWEADRIELKLRYPTRESGYTMAVGISKPTEVLVDGKRLPQNEDLEQSDTAGWRYNSGYALLVIRLTEDGEHGVQIQGAAYRAPCLLPEPRSRLIFEFEQDPEGWMAANHLEPLIVAKGSLQARITGGDPFMIRNMMSVDGNSIQAVVVRMKAPQGTGAQFYWGNEAAPGFSEERVVNFPIIGDGKWHEYRIAVGDDPGWKGHTITAIRLDPLSPGLQVTVEIDWIRGE